MKPCLFGLFRPFLDKSERKKKKIKLKRTTTIPA